MNRARKPVPPKSRVRGLQIALKYQGVLLTRVIHNRRDSPQHSVSTQIAA